VTHSRSLGRRARTAPALQATVLLLALFWPAWDRALIAQPPAPKTKSAGPGRLIGKPAPDFFVTSLDGKKISLGDYRGKALLINFWATWCGNCKLEMPWLASLQEKYANQSFQVLGIVTDNAPTSKVRSLTAKYGVKYPILECNHATAQAYGGLPELPVSFFVSRHGVVVAEMAGADSEREIESNIRKALLH
jgi:thiol-disulfide isomerase/thioredoxin